MKQNSKTSVDPFKIVSRIKGGVPAPVHLWNPPFCGDIDMLIARDGTWYHEGKPIRRPAMVQLFSSILLREDKEYFLVTPVEKVRIQVEDCPFLVTQMEIFQREGRQSIVFTISNEEMVTVDSQHSIEVESMGTGNEPHPIVHVRNGLNALINRAVFYRLVEAAEEMELDGESVLGVWSEGFFFSLGQVE
ncbi:MAG: hypothetical protein CM1200mP40_34830 [Gammaproteobacteria bacterium]|nr:MAG: hypothetical protein CM1200mP40_34830 [Gammaproteobacteria bacterium]